MLGRVFLETSLLYMQFSIDQNLWALSASARQPAYVSFTASPAPALTTASTATAPPLGALLRA